MKNKNSKIIWEANNLASQRLAEGNLEFITVKDVPKKYSYNKSLFVKEYNNHITYWQKVRKEWIID